MLNVKVGNMNKYVVPCADYVGESGSFDIDPQVHIVYAETYAEALTEAIRIIKIYASDPTDPGYHRAVWHKDDDANQDEEGWIVGNPVLIAKDIKYMTVTPDPDFTELVEVMQWRTKAAAEKSFRNERSHVVEYHGVLGQPVNRYGKDATDGGG